MTPAARVAAAILVLADLDARRRPAAEALKDWGTSHRFAGSGDRAAIAGLVYDALRRKRSAGWLLGEDTPRAIGFGALLLEWNQTARSLNDALDGDKFAPPLLSAGELQAIAASRLADAPPAVRADIPDWCQPLFERAFGARWVEEGAALATRPPLDIRVNTLLADRGQVLAELADTGAEPARIAPDGIRIPPIVGDGRHPNVQVEPAFRKGWFEIQDEGSQIAAMLAGAGAGMQVLDFCAGAGGKTLALSAAMGNTGRIFAHDAEKARLAPIFDRIGRSQNRNVQVVTKPAELAPLAGHMDIVLVDAPCTGSGTWRRRPDAKWRLTQRQLDARKGEQSAILDVASAYVRRGGLLVYITCSVFDEENGEQIAAFRERSSGFVPVDHRELWDRSFPGSEAAVRVGAAGGLSLSPALSGTDGFYVCAVRRAN
jgi:16S rRNA (cytosine967-C5)-methyltransferase